MIQDRTPTMHDVVVRTGSN